jgi:peptidyl-prolyl cis-trans isomerase B (cyclophilin B)
MILGRSEILMRTVAALALLFPLLLAASCGSKETPSHDKGSAALPSLPPGDSHGNAVEQAEAFIAKKAIDRSSSVWKTHLPMPPKFTFDKGKDYHWILDTNLGKLDILLWPKIAPMHVSNAIYLTTLGFYDGLTFHRVIKGFMAQGGDPLGNGMGSPGYGFAGEIDRSVHHDRPGLVSMAHSNLPRSDGSQFFLTFAPRPSLDGVYTIFGEVKEGMDVLGAMEALGADRDPATPRRPIVIQHATIEVK